MFGGVWTGGVRHPAFGTGRSFLPMVMKPFLPRTSRPSCPICRLERQARSSDDGARRQASRSARGNAKAWVDLYVGVGGIVVTCKAMASCRDSKSAGEGGRRRERREKEGTVPPPPTTPHPAANMQCCIAWFQGCWKSGWEPLVWTGLRGSRSSTPPADFN